MNACTHCREQKIRQDTSHRLIHRRSSWRRRHINKPPSGRRIVQNALFKQRGVRMTSSKGDYLLSAYDEDSGVYVDHRPAEVLAAPWSTGSALLQWIAFGSRIYYSSRVQACFRTFLLNRALFWWDRIPHVTDLAPPTV